jgi:hypothetical protein
MKAKSTFGLWNITYKIKDEFGNIVSKENEIKLEEGFRNIGVVIDKKADSKVVISLKKLLGVK